MKLSKILSFAVFCLIVYLMIYVNGFANALIFLLALFIHEGFHFISAKFCGIPLGMPLISPLGLRFEIENTDIAGMKGVLIYLSGALGNIFFAFIMIVLRNFVSIYNSDVFLFYNLMFAFINLIPAFPMDAARAICCILNMKMSKIRAVKIIAFVSELIAYALFLTGAYVFILRTDNMVLMILSIMIFYYSEKERTEAENSFVKNKLNKLCGINYRG